jgi:uncharacterized GH25 family protein
MLRLAAVLFALAPSVFASIRGNVYSADGAPVAGARVAAFRPAAAMDERVRMVSGAAREPVAATTTDDEGAFALELKRTGMIELLVEREGYAPLLLLEVDGADDVVATLTPAESRGGRITAAGKPVANALIIASVDARPLLSARSDAKGAFSLPDPETWNAELRVIHPDYAPVTTKNLNVVLTSGTSIKGRVVRADGTPAGGARIFSDRWPLAASAEDGTFTIAHASAGLETIEAFSGGDFGSAKRADRIEITIAPGRTVTGTVRDASNRPVPAAVIFAQTENDGERSAVADDAGNYRLLHLPAGEVYLAPENAGELVFAPASETLRASTAARADFTATLASFLRGVVVNEKKEPVGGALVVALPAQLPMPLLYGQLQAAQLATVRSGAGGRFKLPVAARFEGRLQALHPRYALGVAEVTRERVQPLVMITLSDGIEVRGRVVDKDGKPVAGALIAAVQDPSGAVPMPLEQFLTESESFRALVRSGSDGAFSVRFNETLHDVEIWKEGFTGTSLPSLKPEAGMEPLKIVLERGVELRGRITAKSPDAVLRGSVALTSDNGMSRNATTEDDGTFAFTSLRPGAYELEFVNEESQSAAMSVRAPAADVVLELPARAAVRGRVVDKVTGASLKNFSIVVSGGTTSFNRKEFEGAEGFSVPIDAGQVEITAKADGYSAETVTAIASLEPTPELTIALKRARTISGRVLTESGTPLDKAEVSIDAEEQVTGMVVTDAEGAFELVDITRDEVQLSARRQGYRGRSVTVKAGDDQRIDLRLPRGRKATGRVVTAAGAAVEGASIWASNDANESQSGESKADGTFEIEGLGDGLHTFRATHDDLGGAETLHADIDEAPVIITFKDAQGTGTIHGKVLGFSQQEWIHASVSAADQSALVTRDGTFRIGRVEAGEATLRLHVATMRLQGSTVAGKVTVPVNGEVERDIVLPDTVVRGTVTEEGVPVAQGTSVSFSTAWHQWTAHTDRNGAYEITGIEPGAYEVFVTSRRRSFATRANVRGSTTFDIAIAFAELEGRVVAHGAPVAAARVEAIAAGSERPEQTTTDSNGVFRLAVNDAESFIVRAAKSGYADTVRKVERPLQPLVLELVHVEPLRVRIVDARSGNTLSGYVVVTDAAGLVAGTADEMKDGVLPVHLLPGAYRVSVSAGNLASQSTRVTMPRDGELRFALTPGGTLIVNAGSGAGKLVKLILPNGEEYVRCECNGIAEIRLEGTTTTIEHIAPGRYTMNVYDEQGRITASQPVTIAEGQTTTAVIHVPQ